MAQEHIGHQRTRVTVMTHTSKFLVRQLVELYRRLSPNTAEALHVAAAEFAVRGVSNSPAAVAHATAMEVAAAKDVVALSANYPFVTSGGGSFASVDAVSASPETVARLIEGRFDGVSFAEQSKLDVHAINSWLGNGFDVLLRRSETIRQGGR